MYSQYIREKLRMGNYKLTGQRAAVLDVMINNRGKHLSAEEVLLAARETMPNIGIATVYRTLDKLASIEILYKSRFESGRHRYELADDGEHQHHHVICIGCNSIIEIKDDLLCELEKSIEKRGYQIVDHDLKFYGYCPRCKK